MVKKKNSDCITIYKNRWFNWVKKQKEREENNGNKKT